MSENKLYVGNLNFQTTEDSLRAAFARFGTVRRTTIVTDRETGRPRGFAFVEMGSDEEAQAAINGLHGQALDGRPIQVNIARPREDRGGAGGPRGPRRENRW